MSEQQGSGADSHTGPITKESLFPDGLPGTPERKAFLAQDRVDSSGLSENRLDSVEESEDNAMMAESEDEALADSQELEEGTIEESEQDSAIDDEMALKQFVKEAGWTLDDWYNKVYVERDGEKVSVSKAWNDYQTLKQGNEALLRERAELQEKANRAATHVQQPGVSPEAQLLVNQAQMKLQQISETDWSQVDPGMAANMKFDLQAQAQQLYQQAQAKQAEHQTNVQTEMRKALEEAERLTRAQIPEWNDQDVRNTEVKAIKDHLSRYGISDQEVDSIVDPRWRRVLRDAQKANASVARVKQGAKTIRKVGKTVAPGARAGSPKTPTLAGARATLQKAKEGGANKEQLARERLAVTLPDIKPAKRVR